ncbi:putative transport [Salmonella enterica subsp. arizonae]|uniref:Putative transport n=1 Tax=Salmonella enterica subsp. arizonae TaxID=59203 RepID=A0A2X4T4T8_SALER|nr:putative transport [Salmonella enterica subsp. arizonae]
MDSLNNDKIKQHSSDLEVESEEKQSGKEIEVDEDRLPSRAMAIHEHIRQDGEKEMERDAMALLWSAIAAGLSMGHHYWRKGFSTYNLQAFPAVFYWKISAIPLVLSLSSWLASNYLLKIPLPPYCR